MLGRSLAPSVGGPARVEAGATTYVFILGGRAGMTLGLPHDRGLARLLPRSAGWGSRYDVKRDDEVVRGARALPAQGPTGNDETDDPVRGTGTLARRTLTG